MKPNGFLFHNLSAAYNIDAARQALERSAARTYHSAIEVVDIVIVWQCACGSAIDVDDTTCDIIADWLND